MESILGITGKALIICLYSYLIGSVPFGRIMGALYNRLKGTKIDIQKTGSGKTGATNVSRVYGIKWGIVVGILDAGKGILAVLLTGFFFPEPRTVSQMPELFFGLTFLFVVAGHIFPVWLKFKGGAGVGTFVGCLLALIILNRLDWQVLLIILACWLFVLRFVTRRQMSTTNLIVAAGILLFILFIPVFLAMSLFITLVVGLIWWAHRENLKRISQGKEPSLKLAWLDKIPFINRLSDDGIGWLVNKLQIFVQKRQNAKKRPG